MHPAITRSLVAGAAALLATSPAHAQHAAHGHGQRASADTAITQHPAAGPGSAALLPPAGHAPAHPASLTEGAEAVPGHEMPMLRLGGGWTVMGMGQVFPIATRGEPFDGSSPLNRREVYFTQPAAMINLESPGSALVLRTTLNFEAWTQEEGEYTFGSWGEGFIDKRHPHTLLHEAMASVNVWNAPGGAFSLSAGKGFAPYGSDDPMSRPAVKYPTNHHLSQVVERWTVNAAYLHRSGLSLEAGLFGGGEPDGPYDFGNIRGFGDSWSARAAMRFGGRNGPAADWEVSASFARVAGAHGGQAEHTRLVNAAVRHERGYRFGGVYALLEASRSEPEGAEKGYAALLGETRLKLGPGRRHQPYWRTELATRPEYHRAGALGTDDWYRYDHAHGHTDGATRWLVNTAGYAFQATGFPFSAAPFVELQHNRVWRERGTADPRALFGKSTFWSLSTGFRIHVGGGPMRMGAYGVLDPMTAAMRAGRHGAHGAAGDAQH
ncbi:MAG TPA: hypothetical protein VFJ16_21795 [Longimicrobium sp.]|nr:hypothetical protein [Longimicrobium sp.]